MSGALPWSASEDSARSAHPRAGDDAEPADESGAEIRHDVTVRFGSTSTSNFSGP